MGNAALKVPDFINHPTHGPTLRDVRKFFELTQLNEYELNTEVKQNPFAAVHRFPIPNRGIVSMLRFEIRLRFTVAGYTTGAFTYRAKWVEGFIRDLIVRGNGTDIWQGSGMDAREIVHAMMGQPDYTDLETKTITASNGDKEIVFPIVIPLASDQATAMGSIFAETAHNKLTVQMTFEELDELLGLPAGVTLENPEVEIITFATASDVPVWTAENGAVMYVVPDVSVVQMVNSHDSFPSANKLHRIGISPSGGQLERLIIKGYDQSAKAFFDVRAQMERYGFRYGQNQLLRDHSAYDLLLRNLLWYRGKRLPHQALAFDLVAENSLRDSIVPEDHLGLEVLWKPKGSTSVAAGDEVRVVEQILSPSAQWMGAQVLQAKVA